KLPQRPPSSCTAVVREVDDRSKAFDVALILSNIRDLQHLLCPSNATQRDLGPRGDYRFALSFARVSWRYSMHGDSSKSPVLGPPKDAEIGATDMRSAFQHSFKHWLELSRRTADDL